MTLDLLAAPESAQNSPWSHPATYWGALTAATADLSGPIATLSIPAMRYNALDMVVRSGGVPIRVASKSIRVREIIDATLALPGYAGILAFTLPEALEAVR